MLIKQLGFAPRATLMAVVKKEETLRRIKEVEEEVKRLKEAATAQQDKILLDARREQFELKESLRQQAEKRHTEVQKEVEAVTRKETAKILAKGRKEAETLRAEAAESTDRAAEKLVEKFKGASSA